MDALTYTMKPKWWHHFVKCSRTGKPYTSLLWDHNFSLRNSSWITCTLISCFNCTSFYLWFYSLVFSEFLEFFYLQIWVVKISVNLFISWIIEVVSLVGNEQAYAFVMSYIVYISSSTCISFAFLHKKKFLYIFFFIS